MWTCILCDNKDEWTRGLCTKCEEVKKIVDIYGIDKVVESIKYIYVRDDEPIKNRQKHVANRQ
tara:strand:- start:102 stop:290 length:189 start_codon:yes stop_codon:yes gene_type:complete